MKKKLPKVIETKLGQEQAEGIMVYAQNTIYIDERLRGKAKFLVYIHELLHFIYPEKTEREVIRESELITEFLWKHHFRIVENV